ncbi:MAG: DUF6377 domain-containing protein [Tannerellaceae bacterium]|nr:DUF6377 domain-containing protein [Tannerellaceae bacterium]
MRNRLLLFLLYLCSTFFLQATEREDWLEELDRIVTERPRYMERKEKRIDNLRQLQRPGLSLEEKYRINHAIYQEYNTYRYDSAMHYVFLNREIARQLNNPTYMDETAIAFTILLATTGMYHEALENLAGIQRETLAEELLPEYYSVAEWTYYAASALTNDQLFAPSYKQMEDLYRDSVFSVLEAGTADYIYYEGKIAYYTGNLQKGLDIFLGLYPEIPVDTRLYAIVTWDIANIYKHMGRMDLYEKFLVLAAISDQVCPLKENLAMQELALYLYSHKPEEIDRAYRYIQCSMEDAHFYNNRLRILQISQKLPIIVTAYQQKSEKEKNSLALSLRIISLLSLFTILLLFYLYKQIRVVKKSRQELHLLNEKLNVLNHKLYNANLTKEEYVGLFMDLCSTYIDKLNKYRETVKRKIIAKQIDDLYKMTNSTRAIEVELDHFFLHFDNAFLSLYPTFVEDINKLLTEEGKIKVKKGELLNTELRIFALIRLGIKDSSKIAAFLRYSPQTIYNYRTKVKNKSVVSRESFEDQVMEIGNLS